METNLDPEITCFINEFNLNYSMMKLIQNNIDKTKQQLKSTKLKETSKPKVNKFDMDIKIINNEPFTISYDYNKGFTNAIKRHAKMNDFF